MCRAFVLFAQVGIKGRIIKFCIFIGNMMKLENDKFEIR